MYRKRFVFVICILVVVGFSWCEESVENSIETEEDVSPKRKSLNLIQKLREQIKQKEKELENAEKINKNFERMIQLVNIMGQVDTFLTDRTKLVLKKLALLAEDSDTNNNRKANIKF